MQTVNKIGIYFAFWERNWTADYASYIRKVKRLGFDTLELEVGALEKMGADRQLKLAELAREEGLDLTYCIGLPPAYDVSSADNATRRAGIEYVGRLLDTVYRMKGNMMGGILYACWPMKGAPSYEDKLAARERALESVKEISKKAEE